jgi:hypothetical protein
MRGAIILVGGGVALAVIVVIVVTAPTLVVSAPLWIMALCVITGAQTTPAESSLRSPVGPRLPVMSPPPPVGPAARLDRVGSIRRTA